MAATIIHDSCVHLLCNKPLSSSSSSAPLLLLGALERVISERANCKQTTKRAFVLGGFLEKFPFFRFTIHSFSYLRGVEKKKRLLRNETNKQHAKLVVVVPVNPTLVLASHTNRDVQVEAPLFCVGVREQFIACDCVRICAQFDSAAAAKKKQTD